MSAPVCLRVAIEACRPSKVSFPSRPPMCKLTNSQSSALRLRPLFQTRKLNNATTDKKPSAGINDVQPSTPSALPDTGSIPSKPPVQSHITSQSAWSNYEIPDIPNGPTKHLPPNVLAAYRAPLKHTPPLGLPCASLQLRSFSVRNLEFFADFCVRAAYYLNLPARGPNPLPKRRERWTVLRGNFVNKKAQENFSRTTHKRLVTIFDGEKSAVEMWLAFIRKWQFYGVAMKANVWTWESLDVGKNMDKAYDEEIEKLLEEKMRLIGFSEQSKKSLGQMMDQQGPRREGTPMAILRDPKSKRVLQTPTEDE